MSRGRHTHPNYYYAMRDEIIALMDDQSGKPFDVTNYRKQFRTVAIRHEIFPGSDSYPTHFRIVQGMVSSKLPKMKPRQASLA